MKSSIVQQTWLRQNVKVSGERSPDEASKCWAAIAEVDLFFDTEISYFGHEHKYIMALLWRLTGESLKRWLCWTRKDMWPKLWREWRGGRVDGASWYNYLAPVLHLYSSLAIVSLDNEEYVAEAVKRMGGGGQSWLKSNIVANYYVLYYIQAELNHSNQVFNFSGSPYCTVAEWQWFFSGTFLKILGPFLLLKFALPPYYSPVNAWTLTKLRPFQWELEVDPFIDLQAVQNQLNNTVIAQKNEIGGLVCRRVKLLKCSAFLL